MADTAKANEQDVAGATAPAARPARPVKAVEIFLDKSRDFATVHGERGPSDPHHGVCYVQNGLLFDAAGKLLMKHPDNNTDNAKVVVAKLAARAHKRAEREAAKAMEEEPEADDELDAEDDGGAIDLKAWAMGERKYLWQLVTDAIVMKYGKRCSSKRDACETLIAEGIVQQGQLSPDLRSAMNRL